MSNPLQNLPDVSGPEKVVTVLAIGGTDEDLASLGRIFGRTNWVLYRASTCREGYRRLRESRIPVVISAPNLPDGTWRDVLREVSDLPDAPLLLVASHQADDSLWGEVLNLGGYDVLSKPFDLAEVIRTVSIAWLHWRHTIRGRAPFQAPLVAAMKAATL